MRRWRQWRYRRLKAKARIRAEHLHVLPSDSYEHRKQCERIYRCKTKAFRHAVRLGRVTL